MPSDEPRVETRAQKRWQKLRVYVAKGFYNALLNQQKESKPHIFAVIERLWRFISKHATTVGVQGVLNSSRQHAFRDRRIAAELKTLENRKKSLGSLIQYSSQNLGLGHGRADQIFYTPAAYEGARGDFDEMLLDTIPFASLYNSLTQISNTISAMKTIPRDFDLASYKFQFNCAWKIFILAMCQADPAHRTHILLLTTPMVQNMHATLYDYSIKENFFSVLFGVVYSDERLENRLLAIHLLGEVGIQLGVRSDDDILLLSAFEELGRSIIELVFLKREKGTDGDHLIIAILGAIGKFIRVNKKMPLFIFNFLGLKAYFPEAVTLPTMTRQMRMIASLFDVLNDQIPCNALRKRFVGMMFRTEIADLMGAKNVQLRSAAIKFTSKWLPISNDDANVASIEVILSGLQKAKEIANRMGHPNLFDKDIDFWNQEMKVKDRELTLRRFLSRQIMLPPGTYTFLRPVDTYKHVFAADECFMMGSQAIVAQLPIHPDSTVFLYRPVPPIPGVPPECTSAPPIFAETSRFGGKVDVRFKDDKFWGLPFACTYAAATSKEGEFLSVKSLIDSIPPHYLNRALSERKQTTGFLSNNPFSNLDIAFLDRFAKYTSAIYSTEMREFGTIPDGYTRSRHPILWASKAANLTQMTSYDDFMLNAPVVLDILPGDGSFNYRVLCKVVGVDQEMTGLKVISQSDSEELSPGYTFNMHAQSRSEPYNWRVIHLQVVDNHYEDDVSRAIKNGGVIDKKGQIPLIDTRDTKRSLGQPKKDIVGPPKPVTVTPVSFDDKGQYLFAPPINFPPFPAGYNKEGDAYYGKSSLPKTNIILTVLQPEWVSSDVHTIGGYDQDGNQFFLPPGTFVPTPSGFTVDGIPFYEINKILQTKGTMLVPPVFSQQFRKLDPSVLTDLMTERVKLTAVEEKVYTEVAKSAPPPINIATENPQDLLNLLSMEEEVTMSTFKVSIDPPQADFQSVRHSAKRDFVVRYKTGKGDSTQHTLYAAAQPSDVFELNQLTFNIQGEGMVELIVSFDPLKLPSEEVLGSLNIIDKYGRLLCTSQLKAIRKYCIQVTPDMADFGWILPGTGKQTAITLENVMDGNVVAELRIRASKSDPESPPPPQVFQVPTTQLKFGPHEKKVINLSFETTSLGHWQDVMEIILPSGDIMSVPVDGICGIPLVIYPEDEVNSKAGSAALARERCNFMKKFKRSDGGKGQLGMTEEDRKIFRAIMTSKSEFKAFEASGNIDFGIISEDNPEPMTRCLTLFNMSVSPLTVGLCPKSPHIQTLPLVRIAPKTAYTLDVTLDVPELIKTSTGDVRIPLELVSADFQTLIVKVRIFIGIPAFLPIWDYAFFPPCSLGQETKIETTILNVSNYSVKLNLEFTEWDASDENRAEAPIKVSRNNIISNQLEIAPQSTTPVTLIFTPNRRGPFIGKMMLDFVSPFQKRVYGTQTSRILKLVGICVVPHNLGKDFNCIEDIRLWLSHPKRIIDQYSEIKSTILKASQGVPDNAVIQAESMVRFKNRAIEFQNPPNHVLIDLSHESYSKLERLKNSDENRHEVVLLGSTGFILDPYEFDFHPRGEREAEIIFQKPVKIGSLESIYGFIVAVDKSNQTVDSIAVSLGAFSNLFVFPNPDDEGMIRLQFGTIELSNNSRPSDYIHQLLLFNQSQVTALQWQLTPVGPKKKWSVFNLSHIQGELDPLQSQVIEVKFMSESASSFEATFELFIKDASDRQGKFDKAMSVVCQGNTVYTSLMGVPEMIDFGTLVTMTKKKKQFSLINDGHTAVNVSLLTRAPFVVSPLRFPIDVKSSQEITVTYSPKESCAVTGRLLFFVNQKVYNVKLVGNSGIFNLQSAHYQTNPIDFGTQPENTITWLPLILTNEGSIPIKVTSIISNCSEFIKIQYSGITATIPSEKNLKSEMVSGAAKKDLWSILRRKITLLNVIRYLIGRKLPGPDNMRLRDDPVTPDDYSGPIKVFDNLASVQTSMVPHILPTLPPFYSYYLKIGYRSKKKIKPDGAIHFYYEASLPVADDDGSQSSGAKKLSVNLAGDVYRPVDIYPTHHDFGVVPAELPRLKFLQNPAASISSHQEKKTHIFEMNAINLSKETQHLSLKALTSCFSIGTTSWTLEPGEKMRIPVEFHPKKEQAFYVGTAIFSHKYGNCVIHLCGTGASAELSVDDELRFGVVKLGTTVTKMLKIKNKGRLPGAFYAELVQKVAVFTFDSDGRTEEEGVVEPGDSINLKCICTCHSLVNDHAYIRIKWEKLPGEPWEVMDIPLKIHVGMPDFHIQYNELDFRTTFTSMEKKKTFTLSNNGDMPCSWALQAEGSRLQVEPKSGVLEPDGKTTLTFTFRPTNFDPLVEQLMFVTDIGDFVLMCYGIVSSPLLKLMDPIDIDFGISLLGKRQISNIRIFNTGKKQVYLQSSIEVVENTEGAIFKTSIDEALILPGKSSILTLEVVSTVYAMRTKATIRIQTNEGEFYEGDIYITGGLHIVNIEQQIFPDMNNLLTSQETVTLNPYLAEVIKVDCILEYVSATLPMQLMANGSHVGDKKIKPLTSEALVDIMRAILLNIDQPMARLEKITNRLCTFVDKAEEEMSSDQPPLNFIERCMPTLKKLEADLRQIIYSGDKAESLMSQEEYLTRIRTLMADLIQRIVPVQISGNIYNLGLIKAGKSVCVYLFTIINTGNLPFQFECIGKTSEKKKFLVFPATGTVQPSNFMRIFLKATDDTTGMCQQTFELFANGEFYSQFSVVAMVGKSHITMDESIIDFGLVPHGKKETRPFVVTNMGTYPDRARVVCAENIRKAARAYDFNDGYMYLDAAESKQLEVTYSPRPDREDMMRIRVISGDAHDIDGTLTGVGGFVSIEYYLMHNSFNKLLAFGNCRIGSEYKRILNLKNKGNMKASLRYYLNQPHEQLRIEQSPPAEVRLIDLSPGDESRLNIIYSPTVREQIDDMITFEMDNLYKESFPVTALSGNYSRKVHDFLKVVNVKQFAVVSKFLIITNNGDFPFEISTALQPPGIGGIMSFVNPLMGQVIEPNEKLSIEIQFSPTEIGTFEGQIVLDYIMGEFKEQDIIPVKIRVSDKELVLSDVNDYDVGRIPLKEVATLTRNLSNFGVSNVKYRFKLTDETPYPEAKTVLISDATPPKPNKKTISPAKATKPAEKKGKESKSKAKAAEEKPKPVEPEPEKKEPPPPIVETKPNPWSMNTETEGSIPPSEGVDITFTFVAPELEYTYTFITRVTVEELTENSLVGWQPVCSFLLKAGNGIPLLSLVPSELNFMHVPQKSEKLMTFSIQNMGTANGTYQLIKGPDFDNAYKVTDALVFAGMIKPREQRNVAVQFTPSESIEYASLIICQYATTTLDLKVCGYGAHYEIDIPELPPSINSYHLEFEAPFVTRVKAFKLSPLTTEVECSVEINDTFMKEHGSLFSLTTNPPRFVFDGAAKSQSMDIDLEILVNIPDDRELTREIMSHTYQDILFKIQVVNGPLYSIPACFQVTSMDISPVYLPIDYDSTTFDALSQDSIEKIDFGEVPLFEGAKFKFLLFNGNAFTARLALSLETNFFKVENPLMDVPPKSESVVELTLCRLESDDDNVPILLERQDVLTVTCVNVCLQDISIPLSGILKDYPPTIELPEIFDFGHVLKNDVGNQSLVLKNPARYPVEWSIAIDSQMSDIFSIDPDFLKGTLKRHESVAIPIMFKPCIAVLYAAEASLSTNIGNYSFSVEGVGEDCQLNFMPDSADFGIVGVGAPELKSIQMTNFSSKPATFYLESSIPEIQLPSSQFTFDPLEERSIDFIIAPTEQGIEQSGNIVARTEKEVITTFTAIFIGGEFNVKPAKEEEHGGVEIKCERLFENNVAKRSFELVNHGETDVEVYFELPDQTEMKDSFSTENVSVTIEPLGGPIPSHSNLKFNVNIKGDKVGFSEIHFMIRFKKIVDASKSIPFNLISKVISGASLLGDDTEMSGGSTIGGSVKRASRADSAITELLNYSFNVERVFNAENLLAKLLVPVVRISPVLPSKEFTEIKRVEPHIPEIDITPLLIRPPPVPVDIPQQVKKWFLGRQSMLYKTETSKYPQGSDPVLIQRREMAALDMRRLERNVIMNRK